MSGENGKRKGRTKGVYGDRRRIKRTNILMALAILAFIIILVVIGFVRTGSRKNVFTIMAILSVLPFAKLVSILATLLPYPSMSADKAAQIASVEADLEVVYDVIFATEKTVFPIDCALIEEGRILAFSQVKDKKKKLLEQSLKRFMKDQGYPKNAVKIEDDFDTFMKMLSQAADTGSASRKTHMLVEAFLTNCV